MIIPGPPPAGDHVRIAFLGPFGTFTEQAVWQVAPAGAELIPTTSVPAAMAMVRAGKADRAVVAIENSVEGSVNATLVGSASAQSDGSTLFALNVPAASAEMVARLAAADRVALVQTGNGR